MGALVAATMPKTASSVLHVVVGAGIIPHFRNAIESILINTSDLVFAVYNSISSADSDRFSDFVANSGFGGRVVFRTLGNDGPSKTGSLYDAYNLAIDFAKDLNFDYLNLVQADCQLMWWSDALVTRLDQIFSAAEASDGRRVLCVATAFPVFGKFAGSNFLNDSVYDPGLDLYVYTAAGMGDVGIFSMSAIRASGFRFVGTEPELQESTKRDGYQIPSLDVPCVAFLPWPATVRNQKVVGTVVEPEELGAPLLSLVEGFPPNGLERSRETEPFWMEDWIVPNGWDCFFPYWPTSIENPKWFKRRIEACRLLGVKPWATAMQVFGGVSSNPPRWRLVPTLRDVMASLARGYFRAFIGYQRRLFRSLGKRLGAVRS
jgi:hypothetical protein